MKKRILLICLLTGCATYKIPLQTVDHPASAKAQTSSIELSPLLDINEINNKEETEETHADH